MQIPKRRFIIYYLPVFIYVAIILALSTIPPDSIPDVETAFPIDKVVHFFEYGVFAVILFRAFIHSGFLSAGKTSMLIFLCIAAMGAIDESYQHFTGRSSDLYDWLADCLGGITASLFCFMLNIKLKSVKNGKRWNFWLRKIVCDDEG